MDLNRAGVPLLEIVSEPDLHSAEAARAYGEALRDILRYLGVNSGDMEKGVIRFEANISVRPKGTKELGMRTEVKNLNSFRAMERAIVYEIERQTDDPGRRREGRAGDAGLVGGARPDLLSAQQRGRTRLSLLPRAGPASAGR